MLEASKQSRLRAWSVRQRLRMCLQVVLERPAIATGKRILQGRLNFTRHFTFGLTVALSLLNDTVSAQSAASAYEFKGGYPTLETIQKTYADLDLNRPLQCYRVFYPTVSGGDLQRQR
jgi:hypothetical protein